MILEYVDQGKDSIAFIKNDYGQKLVRIVFSPVSVYTTRQDDYDDVNVPYTCKLEMDGVLCSTSVLNEEDLQLKIAEAAQTLVLRQNYKSIFVTLANQTLHDFYIQIFNNFAQNQGAHTVLDNNATQSIIQNWTGFQERFGNNETWPFLIFMFKDEHESVYQTNWIKQDKATK